MRPEQIHIRMEEAKGKMDRAEAAMLGDPFDDQKFIGFIRAKENYWRLADWWVAAVEEEREQEGFGFELSPPAGAQGAGRGKWLV